MHVILAALAGVAVGPILHHLAVQSGADLGFSLNSARCRRCDAPSGILRPCAKCGLGPARALAAATFTAILFGSIAWRFGLTGVLVAYLFFGAMTVVLFITDIDHKRIPNRITYPGTPTGALLLALGALVDGTTTRLPTALLGALVYSGVFFLVYLAARGGFGFGDVKLAVSLGLFAAFLGWDRLFLSGMATAAAGGVIALVAVVAGRAGAKTEIPYGPPMIVGTWTAILAYPWLSGIL